MSRSYRKPFVTDGYKGSGRRQFFKNYANRILRRKGIEEEIANGKAYKKYSDGWNICDYRWYESLKTMSSWTDKPWQLIRK